MIADDEIVAALRRALPEASAILLFGSHAAGAARPDSDLDLAVLLPGRADPVRLWHVAEEMAAAFGVDVDLIDLGAASTVMQHQIITTGRTLFVAGLDFARYEAFILSAMTALTEAREPLLAEIKREGRVYGR